MAVDLINFLKMETLIGGVEISSNNLEQQILRILQSHHRQQQQQQVELDSSKQAVKRTGHARFRRGPADPVTSTSQPEKVKPKEAKSISDDCKSTISPISSGSSSITGEEGTVSNGKPLLPGIMTSAPRTYSAGKPPLPSTHRKRIRDLEAASQGKNSHSGGCHCCKRRKLVKREIQRITTSSSSTKVAADAIPADAYSWKKYDQKLIPGTNFPRGYYKCNTVKGCPARKKVERAHNDPTALIVTYEGEHRHHRSQSDRWMKPEITTTLTGT